MHISYLFGSVAVFSVCVSGLAPPKLQTVTKTITNVQTKTSVETQTSTQTKTITQTQTSTQTKTVVQTTTTTKTIKPSPSAYAAAGFSPGNLSLNGGQADNNSIPFSDGGEAIIQTDGSFEIYDSSSGQNPVYAIESSGQACGSGCKAAFTSDGDFQITTGDGMVIFSTGTGGSDASLLMVSPVPPYLVVYNDNGKAIFDSGDHSGPSSSSSSSSSSGSSSGSYSGSSSSSS